MSEKRLQTQFSRRTLLSGMAAASVAAVPSSLTAALAHASPQARSTQFNVAGDPPRQLLGSSIAFFHGNPVTESERMGDLFGIRPQMERIFYQLDVNPTSDDVNSGFGRVTSVIDTGRVPWLSIAPVAGGAGCAGQGSGIPYDDVIAGDHDALWRAVADRLADYDAETWFQFNVEDDRPDRLVEMGPPEKSMQAAKHVREVMLDHRNLPKVVFARNLTSVAYGFAADPPRDPGAFQFGSGYDVYAVNTYDAWQAKPYPGAPRKKLRMTSMTGRYLEFIRDPVQWYEDHPALEVPPNLEPPPYRAAIAEFGSSVDPCNLNYHANWLTESLEDLRNMMPEIEAACYWHSLGSRLDARFAGSPFGWPKPQQDSVNAWVDSASRPQHQVGWPT